MNFLCLHLKFSLKCISNVNWHVCIRTDTSLWVFGRCRDANSLDVPDLVCIFANGAIRAEFA